jgi:predicted nucleic acid-binding protein
MIVLDTNVLSEAMKPLPEQRVIAWLDNQAAETLFITSVTLAELLSGIELLPEGRRKRGLRDLLDEIVEKMIGGRVLPFEALAAAKFAQINQTAVSKGFNIGFADGLIASTALVHGYSIATRDEGPFRAMGAVVINPWDL